MSEPVKPEISYDDFDKLDIRVGLITSVEDVAQSKKLVKITADFGDFTRQILSSFKDENRDPQSVVGKKCLFVVNMAPHKMAGEVSEGLLLDLGYDDGLRPPALAIPDFDVPAGTRLS